jgi:cell division ATPase FtsA
MKFNPLLSKEKKLEYFLGLDIGSEAVKSLIFQRVASEKEETRKMIIWSRGLEYFDKSNILNSQKFEENTIKNTILESVKGAYQSFLQNFGSKTNIHLNNLPTLVNLSPNILREKVMIQFLERENGEVVISKKEEDEIRESVFKNIKGEIGKNFANNFGIPSEDIQFISFKILEIKLDGYNVLKLEGFKGKKLDFRISVIFSLKKYLKNIEKILKDLKLNFSRLLNKEKNVDYLFEREGDEMIFLDIGGEISQVFLVKGGKTDSVFEFESGGLDFTEKLSRVLGLSLEDARNLKHNYSNLVLSEEVRKKVREILSEEIRSWFSDFKSGLRIILEKHKSLLPSNISICGGGSLLPEIKEIIEEGNWEELPFVSRPRVKLIYPKDLKDVEDMTKGLFSPQDFILILACLPSNKGIFLSFDK